MAVLLLGIGLSLAVARLGPPVLLAVLGCCGFALLTLVAYRYPAFTIGAWLVTAQLVWEAAHVGLLPFQAIRIGGAIDVRLSDPFLLGMAGALTAKFVSSERPRREQLLTNLSMWLLLVLWLFVQAGRSLGSYSIVNVLGELRTSFGPLLALPYVLLFFTARHRQARLLRLLIGLTLLMIIIGLIKGVVVYQLAINPYAKWLGAHSAAAVLFGAVAIYLSRRTGTWPYGSATYVLWLTTATALIVICSHRSVWMTSAAAILALWALRHLSLSTALKIIGSLALATVLVELATAHLDVLTFIHQRLGAFYDFDQDATARWRLEIWSDALRQTQGNWLMGTGLGGYFHTTTAAGHAVTASLHNQYIQLFHKTGLVGVVLYAAFVAQVFRHLMRARAVDAGPVAAVAVPLALTLLFAVSIYYTAYNFDYVSWMFIGLGLAAATRVETARRPSYRSVPSWHHT